MGIHSQFLIYLYELRQIIMKTFFIVAAIIFVFWTIWSLIISRAEQMTYTVLEKYDKYEIRQYDPYIAATVQVNGRGKT